jgi:hypothetical protein
MWVVIYEWTTLTKISRRSSLTIDASRTPVSSSESASCATLQIADNQDIRVVKLVHISSHDIKDSLHIWSSAFKTNKYLSFTATEQSWADSGPASSLMVRVSNWGHFRLSAYRWGWVRFLEKYDGSCNMAHGEQGQEFRSFCCVHLHSLLYKHDNVWQNAGKKSTVASTSAQLLRRLQPIMDFLCTKRYSEQLNTTSSFCIIQNTRLSSLHDLRFPLQCKLGLRSSGVLCSVDC